MQRQTKTAGAQLERILYILPAAARGDGVDISELADALDVSVQAVLDDLEAVTTRAYYHPAGAVDSFSIFTDGRRVQVDTRHEFDRPVRLTQRETLALGLGLRMLAADADAERRRTILELADRLEMELAAPDVVGDVLPAAPYDAAPSLRRLPDASDADAAAEWEDTVEYDDELMLGFEDDGFRGVVADAVELGRLCTLWYLKPGDLAPMHRRVAPYRLVHANGMWYVAAFDLEREDLRFFRMDRVLDATLEEDAAPPAPAELDTLLRSGAPYIARDEMEVEVRYAPRVARWVMEKAPVYAEPDGSVLVTHRVADPRWIVRHVMQYGGDATIEQPEPARWWVVAAANRIAAD